MAAELCKYYKNQRYVSYNNGQTWQPLDEYTKGELYESHSSSCGSGVFQYRWVLIDGSYICDGKDRYTREMQQYSEDGIVWYNVFPTVYRKATLVEQNSEYCNNAGGGQYTSGDTEPTSGDTSGDTPTCPNEYYWNGYDCVCGSEIINGVCVSCMPNSTWNGKQCVCDRYYKLQNGVCVYVDPSKTVKCEYTNGILTQSDVGYFESGWTLLSYTVGDCIYRIDDSAFNGHIILTSVTIPSSVEEVGNLAFANCQYLQNVSFPGTLTSIGSGIFYNCSSLKSVNFGNTVLSSITNSMFSECDGLESVGWLQYNPITSIGVRAFNNCYSLSSIVLPNTLETIGSQAFYSCLNLENIVIPSGVTSIGGGAFGKCDKLTAVTINSNNIIIGNGAFNNCKNLTAVTINSSGITVGSDAFNGCTGLLKITFTTPTPFQISSGFFDNTNECALFVPCESLEAYKTAWPEYADRIRCNDTGIYYRWVDSVSCDGTDEYNRLKQQETTDGITWTDNGVYGSSTFITHYSKLCGYSGDVALGVKNEDGYTRYYEPCN